MPSPSSSSARSSQQVRSSGDELEVPIILADLAWTHAALDEYDAAWRALGDARAAHEAEVGLPAEPPRAHAGHRAPRFSFARAGWRRRTPAYHAYAASEVAAPELLRLEHRERPHPRQRPRSAGASSTRPVSSSQDVVRATARTEIPIISRRRARWPRRHREPLAVRCGVLYLGAADRLRAETRSLVLAATPAAGALGRARAAIELDGLPGALRRGSPTAPREHARDRSPRDGIRPTLCYYPAATGEGAALPLPARCAPERRSRGKQPSAETCASTR